MFFYGNCEHWVEPVTSGAPRVVLVCKVFSKEGVTERKMVGSSLSDKILTLVSNLRRRHVHYFQTHHTYATDMEDDMDPKFLKGVDKAFYEQLKSDSATVDVTLVTGTASATFSIWSGECTEELNENDELFEDDVDCHGCRLYYSSNENKWKELEDDAGNEASHVTQRYIALFFRIFKK